MQAMPITVTMKSSGEPKVSTSGRTIGIDTASAAAPITAPTSELISAAPSARAGFAVLGHRVAVDHGGRRQSLARARRTGSR